MPQAVTASTQDPSDEFPSFVLILYKIEERPFNFIPDL